MSSYDFWGTEITFLKKVGPKRAELLLSECGIRDFWDLLNYFPRKYIDKSRITPIAEINPAKQFVTLVGKIDNMEVQGTKYKRRLTARFYDDTGAISLIWFKGVKWIQDNIKNGQELVLFGSPKIYRNSFQIAHPETESRTEQNTSAHSLKIVPFYPSTEKLKRAGLDAKGFRTLLHTLLEIGKNELHESLPDYIINKYNLVDRKEAYAEIHFPTSNEALKKAEERLKFEEFFFFQIMLAQRKAVQQPLVRSAPFPKVGEKFNTFYHQYLPFDLTNAQKRVLKEIRKDLAQSWQMNRLVQGDVGSGKTMVAFLACLIAIDNGFQATLMAPTEILAEQHYQKFTAYGAQLGLKIAYIVGGQKKSVRKQVLMEINEGHAHIAVGTHALIEDPVKFQNLGLTIVDEQHKFGVLQRARLWKKGKLAPHNMVMTATPIPRTLGMTLYGDLDVSVIDELPPGRIPVKTAVRSESQRLQVFGFIEKELEQNRQAYVVYPLVEASVKLDYLAATEGFEAMSRRFKNYRIGIVHGRQKSADKEMEMKRFKKGELKILVSTTVIEVGVDVPQATIMVIENAEKFGLSQLHQLRGRVGRGADQSYCILMVGKKASDDAKKRLKAMVQTTDGFKISEIDLKLRGPGDFVGTRQSGLPEFKIANIAEDQEILILSREAAFDVIGKDSNLEKAENKVLKIYFDAFIRANKNLIGIA